MVWYLLKILYLVIISIVTIFYYYFIYKFHIESSSWTISYIVFILFLYSIYKIINYFKWQKNLIFRPISFVWYFFLQLFLLSIMYFWLIWDNWSYWFALFFKIIWYLILPATISYISVWFWKYLTDKIPASKNESSIFRLLTSIWLWFFSFSTLLFIIWSLGFYNKFSVFAILIFMIIISYKQIYSLILNTFTYKISVEDHDYEWNNFFKLLNFNLLSWEFLFIIITFLLSVNLINVVRPMPIGWDDMWVYMNYPQILANSGTIWNIWSSLYWTIFTWIWFMFKSATQAFFLNNVGWILSVIVLILSTYDLIVKNSKKTFINLQMLAWTIFASMPMFIFQQAKDQKQDPGLFFVSTIAVYLVLYLFLKYVWYKKTYTWKNFEISQDITLDSQDIEITVKWEENIFISHFRKYISIWERDLFKDKSYLIFIFIIWILVWYAFAIKFTTLLLLSGVLAVIFYAKLWVAWLFSYISLYLWIFTKFGLWSMMNVTYPDTPWFKNTVFIWSLIISIVLFSYSIYKYSLKSFKTLLVLLLIFFSWFGVAIAPSFIKNIVSLGWEKITIWSILGWKADVFSTDYTKIYSKEELENIEKNYEQAKVNEDFWRYIGYDKGINNYMKLPYNLTMQTNQTWEFTDITYLYFLLVWTLVLFFSYRNKYLSIIPLIWTALTYLFFVYPGVNEYFSNIFSKIDLPNWYFVIWLPIFALLIYLIYSLDKEKHSVLLKLNLVFGSFYIFLWTISAFWIVWYWVVMYYSLIIFILIGLYNLSNYEDRDELKQKIFKLFGSIITFFIISIYFLFSSIPHWISNLTSAWVNNFKAWMIQKYVSIFESQPTYMELLLELNIENKESLYKELLEKTPISIKNIITQKKVSNILAYEQLLKELSNITDNSTQALSIKQEALNLRVDMYEKILYPSKQTKNSKWIYRIWTFLSYYIIDNNKRLFWDSLIDLFDKYFYDENDLDKSLERMQKMWMSYLLADLNAATIDKDSRRALTKRFDNLLKTFTSEKVELIWTDSICLKVWLESYKKWVIDYEKYTQIAWVNYESYKDWILTYSRTQKQEICYNYVLNLMNSQEINETSYSYLIPYVNYLNSLKEINTEILQNFFTQNMRTGYLVLFKIKD